MTMDLLKQIASSRLPISFYRTEDIDRIRILRAAGLIVALVPADPLAPSGSTVAAQVLAVTQKGREELMRFNYPELQSSSSHWRVRMPRIVSRHRSTGAASPQASRTSSPPQ